MSTRKQRENLKGSTQLLYDELTAQGAQPTILSVASSMLEYTDQHGVPHFLFSTCSDKSSALGRTVAESKARTALIAAHIGITIPASESCYSVRDARRFLKKYGAIVTKPLNGSGGRGVSTNITTDEALTRAYAYAKTYSRTIVAQQHINGTDVRLLTIGGTFCSAVIRRPAHVTGDGVSTVEQLIMQANTTTPRSDKAFMSILPINLLAAKRYLGDGLQIVPSKGEVVRTTGPANVSLGGSLHEATHLVPPDMIADAEKISTRLGLGICGVDMMWDQAAGRYYLIEINATPGIDIHNDPTSGTQSDCVARYVQWLIR